MSKQKITYEEMISKLQSRTYEAPNSWSFIESDLDLNQKVAELKTYSAPDDLWDKIDAELEPPILEAKVLDVKSNSSKRLYYLAAASLVFIIASVWMIPNQQEANVSYTSEVEGTNSTKQMAMVTNPENDLSEAYDFIKENEFLYTAKDKIDYEKQLEELQEAKKNIQYMQEQYGVDKNTQKMQAKVERQIAELLKSMIKAA